MLQLFFLPLLCVCASACSVSLVELLLPVYESILCRSGCLWEMHRNLLTLRIATIKSDLSNINQKPCKRLLFILPNLLLCNWFGVLVQDKGRALPKQEVLVIA